jgi:hypothetical protein
MIVCRVGKTAFHQVSPALAIGHRLPGAGLLSRRIYPGLLV